MLAVERKNKKKELTLAVTGNSGSNEVTSISEGTLSLYHKLYAFTLPMVMGDMQTIGVSTGGLFTNNKGVFSWAHGRAII